VLNEMSANLYFLVILSGVFLAIAAVVLSVAEIVNRADEAKFQESLARISPLNRSRSR
jgi:type IV secretory pathway VirB3-like protein